MAIISIINSALNDFSSAQQQASLHTPTQAGQVLSATQDPSFTGTTSDATASRSVYFDVFCISPVDDFSSARHQAPLHTPIQADRALSATQDSPSTGTTSDATASRSAHFDVLYISPVEIGRLQSSWRDIYRTV